MYIKNANIVLENGILWNGVLQIEGERITSLGKEASLPIPEGAEVVDAKGAYVGPGFVDIHTHGGGGHMFYSEPERAAAHFLAHGETSILATLYYDLSYDEFVASIDRVKEAMDYGIAGKAIAGFYMEGPYMNPKYGASPEKNKWKGEIRKEDYSCIVNRAGDRAKVWAVAPEREDIEQFISYVKQLNSNAVFAVGHSEAGYSQIKKLQKYGLTLQTHCMNATANHSDWVGTRGFGPDETCMLEKDMYAELICDSAGVHVSPELLRLVVQTKGVDKIILISDSFVSDKPNPEGLKHITDLCFDDNGLLCGSKLTLDVACRNIMHHTPCGIVQAFLMASRNPARVIGMDNEIGSIKAGKRANLVFVDDMIHVKNVMLNGRFVSEGV